RLRALGALRDLELYALRLFQRAVAVRIDRRVVDEDVGAAAVLGDEAIALLSVEPLDGSLCHCAVSFRGRCGSGRVPLPSCRNAPSHVSLYPAMARVLRKRTATATAPGWHGVRVLTRMRGRRSLSALVARLGRVVRLPLRRGRCGRGSIPGGGLRLGVPVG